MSDEVVVWEGVTRYGLHGVHVMRMGGKVERDGWLLKVLGRPESTRGQAAPIEQAAPSDQAASMDQAEVKGILEYEEEGLAVWHLWIWWKEEHG